ncbi:MAG: ERCC4 domain-containing protein [Gammaproteobacteria bacterium]
MRSIHIIADDRESRSPVIAALKAQNGVDVTVRRLALGDYLVDGRLLFERKTLRDFAVSVKDGRLFEQGIRLAAAPLHKAILLEGGAHDLAASGMRREALQGALVTLTLFLGIPLLRSVNAEESVRLMLYAARRLDNSVPSKPPKLLKGKRPTGKRKVQLRILQAFPGIGADSAHNLLQRFGSIEAVLAADRQTLLGVAGIGTARAKAIRWAVEEPLPPYDVESEDVIL